MLFFFARSLSNGVRVGVDCGRQDPGTPRVILWSISSFSKSFRGVETECVIDEEEEGGMDIVWTGGGSLSMKEKDEAAGETRP